ncbi:MAG: tetratricopeptide repeat protein [Ardenticatenia bacterium]|nr:tetratricopeptide repeat protein [Ardenticatenia bacterium]
MCASHGRTSDSAPTFSFAELEAKYQEQIQLLLTMVRLSRLGGIATVECNNVELRNQLFRYFKQRFAEHDIYVYPIKVSEHDLNLVRVLRDLTDSPGFKDLELVGRYHNIVLFVYGFESYNDEQQEKFLHFLNIFRDGTTIIKQPIVLWGTSEFIQKMAAEAPDFWSWKGMLFQFDAHEEGDHLPARPPVDHYLTTTAHLPEFSIWQELFVPLRGSQLRALEAGSGAFSRQEPWEENRLSTRRWVDEDVVWARVATAPVLYYLTHHERVLLVGAPGAGKTTVLRYYTHYLADREMRRVNQEGVTSVTLPVFVRLNLVRRHQQVETLILDALHHGGITHIQHVEEVCRLLRGELTRLDDQAPPVRLALLFDGLNEIPEEAQEEFFRFLRQISPVHQIVLTCRTEHFVPIDGFVPIFLEPLSEADIELYITRYLDPARGKRLAEEILADPELRQLAHSPLLLFMFTQIADIQEDVALPKNRGLLYEAFVERLLRRTETEWWRIFGRSKAKVQVDVSREVLGYLALAMQHQRLETMSREQCYWLIREATFAASLQASAKDIFEGLLFSGLLRLSGDREQVEFLHQAVREYFAAFQLRELGERMAAYFEDPHDAIHWAGTAVLFFGISAEPTQVFLDIVGDGTEYRRLWIAAEALAGVSIESPIWKRLAEELSDDLHRLATFKFCCGLALEHRGLYERALTYFWEALLLDETLIFVPYEMGIVYRQIGQYEYAIIALREAIRLQPDFVDSYNQLGITYFESGDYERSCYVFEAAVQLEPTNPHHYYNLGQAYKMLGRFDEASRAFTKALDLNPGYEAAQTQLELIRTAQHSKMFDRLSRISLFQSLSVEHRALLARHLRFQMFLPGEIIVRRGDPADRFFVIQEGQVEFIGGDEEEPTVTARAEPGTFFGQLALLPEQSTYPFTARAITHVWTFVLRREDVERIRLQAPDLASTLVQTHVERFPGHRQRP